ncbi:hypothetical protein NP493_334g03021 [Ridgeia piscesae]|uniref:Uncharacterized protein n=1 Tax=Ridgeia piscesae TaxID=27915 RepID=A0AAD9L3S5_RIDPI|nr:hypothetical protein NP493_334g03021 [Ridgeia piscesae]
MLPQELRLAGYEANIRPPAYPHPTLGSRTVHKNIPHPKEGLTSGTMCPSSGQRRSDIDIVQHADTESMVISNRRSYRPPCSHDQSQIANDRYSRCCSVLL